MRGDWTREFREIHRQGAARDIVRDRSGAVRVPGRGGVIGTIKIIVVGVLCAVAGRHDLMILIWNQLPPFHRSEKGGPVRELRHAG